jgi:hypothetical protein
MDVMSDLVEKDVPEHDLPNQFDPRTFAGLETLENPVYAKFNIRRRIAPSRVITTKNPEFVDSPFP